MVLALRESLDTASPVYQQDIEEALGAEPGSLCVPTAFYTEATRVSHAASERGPVDFVTQLLGHTPLDSAAQYTKRADVSRQLREVHHMDIVSWNMVDQRADVTMMRTAGYLRSTRETDFFTEVILENGRPREVTDLVHRGYHVIVTMRESFAANQALHAVVLAPAPTGQIQIVDPDSRNEQTLYSVEDIRAGLQPGGACSIVLPPEPDL